MKNTLATALLLMLPQIRMIYQIMFALPKFLSVSEKKLFVSSKTTYCLASLWHQPGHLYGMLVIELVSGVMPDSLPWQRLRTIKVTKWNKYRKHFLAFRKKSNIHILNSTNSSMKQVDLMLIVAIHFEQFMSNISQKQIVSTMTSIFCQI